MAKSFPNTGVTTGLAADRAALTSPFAGMQFFETDTNILYVYNGTSWIRMSSLGVDTGTLISSQTTAAITGTYATDLIATAGPNVTLSAGVWLVHGGCYGGTTTNNDTMSLRLYNRTDSAIVQSTVGVAWYSSAVNTPSPGYTAMSSLTLTSSKQYCLYLARNGASAPNFYAGAASSVHFINAVKIG